MSRPRGGSVKNTKSLKASWYSFFNILFKFQSFSQIYLIVKLSKYGFITLLHKNSSGLIVKATDCGDICHRFKYSYIKNYFFAFLRCKTKPGAVDSHHCNVRQIFHFFYAYTRMVNSKSK